MKTILNILLTIATATLFVLTVLGTPKAHGGIITFHTTPQLAATYRETPLIVVVPKVVIRPRVVRTGGPHWTHPGNIADHLTGTHGVRPENLPSTREGMLDLHDALHEGLAVRQPPVRVPRAFTRQSADAFCPNGNCPWSR